MIRYCIVSFTSIIQTNVLVIKEISITLSLLLGLQLNAVVANSDFALNPIFSGLDSDGDGVDDCDDLDDDNDGILDDNEVCVSDEISFDIHSGNTTSLSFSGSEFHKCIINLYELDNSLNIKVNGTDLAGEIQFGYGYSGNNVTFENGFGYGENGYPHIWDIEGYSLQVALRLEIGENGNLKIFGVQFSGDSLLPMLLTLPSNPFNWNSSGNNIVEIGQQVVGPTYINGKILVLKKCDTDLDGIPDLLDLDSDNDGCPDVIESGGLDLDLDAIIDGSSIDANGLVDADNNGYDGTTGLETTALTLQTNPLEDIVLANCNSSLELETNTVATSSIEFFDGIPLYTNQGNSNGGIYYQWFAGNPLYGGTELLNSSNVTGANSNHLFIQDITPISNQEICLVAMHEDNSCIQEITCASITITDLTTTYHVSICEGEQHTEGNSVYTTAGSFSDIYASVNGCDSIVITELIVNQEFQVINTISLCEGESYVEGSSVYTEEGIYNNVYTSIVGCDSIVTTELSFNPYFETLNTVTICEGDQYIEGSSVYTITGTYIDSYASTSGCDSIVITELIVGPVFHTTNTVSMCEGESYVEGSSVYTEAGIYYDVYSSITGCDSVVTTELNLLPYYETLNTVAICEVEQYIEGSSVYTITGIYSDSYASTLGCDSIVITELIVSPVFQATNTVGLCEGDSYAEGDSVYTEAGTYSNVYTSITGCDSIIITELTMLPFYETLNTVAICEGGSYVEGDSVYTEEGTYNNVYNSILGCDSLVITVLTLNPLHQTSNEVGLCEGESHIEGNSIYSEEGIYFDIYSNKAGCDSIVRTELYFNPFFETTNNINICEGQNYSEGDSIYSGTGFYTNIYQSIQGCDSIIYTNLIIEALPLANFLIDSDSACVPHELALTNLSQYQSDYTYTWLWNGEIHGNTEDTIISIVESGVHEIGLKVENSLGCSTEQYIQFVAIEAPAYEGQLSNAEECFPYTSKQTINAQEINANSVFWDFGDGNMAFGVAQIEHYYQEAGLYLQSVEFALTNSFGCTSAFSDSATILIHPKPISNFSYQPLDIKAGLPVYFNDLSSEDVDQWDWKFTGSNFNFDSNLEMPVVTFPEGETSYQIHHIVGNSFGCFDSTTVEVDVQSDALIYIPNSFSPNGDGLNDIFLPRLSFVRNDGYHLTIWDRWGQVVFESNDLNIGWDGRCNKQNGYYQKSEIYNYQLKFKSQQGILKVQRGTVTLIR